MDTLCHRSLFIFSIRNSPLARLSNRFAIWTFFAAALNFCMPFKFAIGQSEMAVDPTQIQLIELQDRFRQAFPVLPIAAKARHAGVEFELHRKLPAAAVGKVLAQKRLAHAAECGHQLPVQAGPQLFGLGEIAKNEHR